MLNKPAKIRIRDRPCVAAGSHVHHARLAALVLCDLLSHHRLPSILVCLGYLFFEVNDGLGRVEPLGAAVGAIHDTVASVGSESGCLLVVLVLIMK